MQFYDIAIDDKMVGTHLLTVEDLVAPHTCKLHPTGNVFVHQLRDIEDRTPSTHRERLVIVGWFTRRLGVDTNNFQRSKQERSQLI